MLYEISLLASGFFVKDFFFFHTYMQGVAKKNLFTNFHFQLEIKLEFVKKNNNDNSKNFVTFQLKMTQRGLISKPYLVI